MKMLKKIIRWIKRLTFTSSAQYWDKRYQLGGNSGAGSYGEAVEYKAKILNEIIAIHSIRTVIDFGCGDGNLYRYLVPVIKCTGYDVSHSLIKDVENRYPAYQFATIKHISDYRSEIAQLTMSLDVIYHLVEDEVFHEYMERLFNASLKYVVIYSSNQKVKDTAPHVRHRKFTDWVDRNVRDFVLIEHITTPLPNSIVDFYIYQRWIL